MKLLRDLRDKLRDGSIFFGYMAFLVTLVVVGAHTLSALLG